MGVAYKKLSLKSDFSQMRPSRSGSLIMNAAIVIVKVSPVMIMKTHSHD